MSIEEIYASAPSGKGNVIIHALQIEIANQKPLRFCTGFKDRMLGVNGKLEWFEAASIEIALPSRNTSGQQEISFGTPNVNGEVRGHIKRALESSELVMLELSEFLAANQMTPISKPLRMPMVGASLDGIIASFKCSYKDLLNLSFGDRNRYTADTAIGLRFSQ